MLNTTKFFIDNAISPYEELIAYESLWMRKGASLKKITEYLQGIDRPSKVSNLLFDDNKQEIKLFFDKLPFDFSIITAESYQYPQVLKDAKYPIKLLYYRGDIDIAFTKRRISIVGARKSTNEGNRRAAKLARLLVANNFTIVSGLAAGIDTAALTAAIKEKGRVIGVIGTPINQYYPKENKELQELIAKQHLLVSHVPLYRYTKEPFQTKRYYFPQRNSVMAALSEATVIVEASDTSGSLTQARACIEMGRKLFILNSCFENSNIKWPYTYEKKGAIRINNIRDIVTELDK